MKSPVNLYSALFQYCNTAYIDFIHTFTQLGAQHVVLSCEVGMEVQTMFYQNLFDIVDYVGNPRLLKPFFVNDMVKARKWFFTDKINSSSHFICWKLLSFLRASKVNIIFLILYLELFLQKKNGDCCPPFLRLIYPWLR